MAAAEAAAAAGGETVGASDEHTGPTKDDGLEDVVSIKGFIAGIKLCTIER